MKAWTVLHYARERWLLLPNAGHITDEDTRIRLPHLFVAYLLKMSLGRRKIGPGLATIDACVADAKIQESIQSVSSNLRAHYPPYGEMIQIYGSVKRLHSSVSKI